MAALLQDRLGLAEVELIKGHSGIFDVKVDGVTVARKTWEGFPSDEDCVSKVGAALGA